MHTKQVESKKTVLAAGAQVDDMYDMLAAYDQKVPTKDSVQHDDLRESVQVCAGYKACAVGAR